MYRPLDDDIGPPQVWDSPGIGSLTYIESECRFEIEANVRVVSLQAASSARLAFRNAIRSLTRQCPIILTTEAQVAIQWRVSPQHRYESDGTADVDNIIKPTMDAISGPEGLLVNDCQVQFVECYWIDGRPEHSLSVTISSISGSVLEKDDLVFVEVMPRLYFPINDSVNRLRNQRLLDFLEQAVTYRLKAQAEGSDYCAANACMPSHQFFHRTRISEFPRYTTAEYRAELESRHDPV